MHKVVNKNKEPFDVYIGRGSKWGNPYTHKTNTKAEFIVESRDEAIKLYRKYITVGTGKHLLNDIHELEGKTLGCYCKPKKCHGDVLVDLINDKLNLNLIFE